MSEELKPLACPFCGHVGLGFGDGSTFRWGIASCAGCGASAGDTRREYPDTGAWHQSAIEQWNTRSPAPSPWVSMAEQLEKDYSTFGSCFFRLGSEGSINRIDPSSVYLSPNSREAALQAMVDNAQELGLYDEPTTPTTGETHA